MDCDETREVRCALLRLLPTSCHNNVAPQTRPTLRARSETLAFVEGGEVRTPYDVTLRLTRQLTALVTEAIALG